MGHVSILTKKAMEASCKFYGATEEAKEILRQWDLLFNEGMDRSHKNYMDIFDYLSAAREFEERGLLYAHDVFQGEPPVERDHKPAPYKSDQDAWDRLYNMEEDGELVREGDPRHVKFNQFKDGVEDPMYTFAREQYEDSIRPEEYEVEMTLRD